MYFPRRLVMPKTCAFARSAVSRSHVCSSVTPFGRNPSDVDVMGHATELCSATPGAVQCSCAAFIHVAAVFYFIFVCLCFAFVIFIALVYGSVGSGASADPIW